MTFEPLSPPHRRHNIRAKVNLKRPRIAGDRGEGTGMSMFGFGQRLAAVVGTLALLSVLVAAPAIARAPSWSHKDAHVCLQPGAGKAGCTSVARAFYVDGAQYHAKTKSDLAHAAAAAQASYFHGPDLRTAYGITAQGDPSRVIAI